MPEGPGHPPERVPPSFSDEGQLRLAFRQCEHAAWQVVAQRYGAALRAQAALLLRDDMDPDNAVAQTWFQALRRIEIYDPDRPIYTWLAAICSRVCLRQRKRLLLLITKLRRLWNGGEGRRFEEGFEGGTLVREALSILPAAEREVLALRFLFGLSYREVAEAMGDSPAAVRQRGFRALRRLRAGPHADELRDLLPGEPRSDDDAS